MSLPKSISKEDINKLPLFTFKGNVHLIETKEQALEAVAILEKNDTLGFDTETRAAFRKGESYQIALLQLATNSNAYLFRLNKCSLLPQIANLLANKNIIKTGVAVSDDIKGLQKLHHFEAQNFVELATIAKNNEIKNFGLRGLVALLLGRRLSKKEKISNWEKDPLSRGQITYAACDAVAGLQIYQEFSARYLI